MKTIKLSFLVALLFVGNEVFSQNSGGYSKGIRAGWHYAGMFRSGDQQFSNLNSFYVGFFNEFKSSGLIGGGSGIEYFQNGFENQSGNFRMHTLSLPVYIKPQIGPIFGTAGFSFNFKLGDNREDFPNVITDTKFFDIPLTLGLGVQLGKIQVEARYFWGLFDAAYINGRGYKNQYLQLGGALSF
ncbi:MAG: hypothetical protein LPK80_12365 [Bacteroidota bacterium]|nr:hypothetical protein [Bacteroidota bacterium]MDX5428396.1 hypothetical protein [Bacteroidota bacterium]MDX5506169.1 hypothetical protein [Bacteroidota bacterium]